MVDRENALKEWLGTLIKHTDFILTPLAADASFRRYFRLKYNGLTHVVMDAPPQKETLTSFIEVTQILEKAQVQVPKLIAINKPLGFLLLGDLGDTLLLGELNAQTVDAYYKNAIEVLFKIQSCSMQESKLPLFDKQFIKQEMDLCSEWFFKTYLSLSLEESEQHLIQKTIEWIATEVALQPQVCIHRDYHSRNLMLQPNQSLGVIDFQDAMQGPVTYDLVSLLKDCYIAWPREKVLEWVAFFHASSPYVRNFSLEQFIRAFDLCGLQRHIKVLGIFSRLNFRDNKAQYLNDLPLTLKYVLECTKAYEELHPFFDFLQKRVRLS
jgi:aminoglycoside/choline kinase family phosphotransferase